MESLTLDDSDLSPAEYHVYAQYVESVSDLDDFKRLAHSLKATEIDSICDELHMGSRPQRGQMFAALRLMSHGSSNRSGLEYISVPTDPLILNTKTLPSLPPRDPNPFRSRPPPTNIPVATLAGPPLPPRRPSSGPSLPPRPSEKRRSFPPQEEMATAGQSGSNGESETPSSRAPTPSLEEQGVPQPAIHWDCDILSSTDKYAMIILNQPITRRDIFEAAWKASAIRICADGGANRLHDLDYTYLPTMIKGDLDSIRPDVRQYYKDKGVPIVQDTDEYSTDLMKCIGEVEKLETDEQYPLVFLGGLSGRVDQTVHTMSILFKLRKTRPRSYVLSEESLAWVLDEGSHNIDIDHRTMGQTCGILPVGKSAFVKIRGLKWNLDWETSMEGEVSTSNHLLPEEPVVQVTTSNPVLWCVEIKPIPLVSRGVGSSIPLDNYLDSDREGWNQLLS